MARLAHDRTYTVLCSMPETKRGQYDEELDVDAANPTRARAIAEGVIATDYDPRLRVRRIVRRWLPEVTIYSTS